MRKINKYIYILLVMGSVVLNSCTTDDLNPALEQSKEEEEAILTVSDLEGILKGAYNRMSSSGYYGRDYIVTNEVRTDNAFSNGNSGRFITEGSFAYLPGSTYIWDNAYQVIASANIIIGTDVSVLEGDLDYGNHMKGEAYAIRALAQFDLLKTYGQENVGGDLGVPYITEFKGEDLIPSRPTISENVSSIMADLQTAFDLMNENYYDSSKEFMSKYTAKGIESNVAVYFKMWQEAGAAAKLVIDSGRYSILTADSYIASWSSDASANSLFEIANSPTDNAGGNSLSYIYRRGADLSGSYGDVQVLPNVLTLYGTGDVRADIIGYEGDLLRNIEKYPGLNGTENIPIVRYEQVVLNYAEALFEMGQTGDALTWLNKIPENRNAALYTTITKENLLLERRKEFIFEGIRYDDLMRTQSDIIKVDDQQNIMETIPYGDFRLAFPIPFSELDANSNMEQNPGYTS